MPFSHARSMPKIDAPLVRHEYKAIIGLGQYHCLKSGIAAMLQPDPHMKGSGYFIRSVYFESPANQGYNDKVDGLYQRYKLRIRLYDCSSDTMKFEMKAKRGDRVMKHSFSISREEAIQMVAGAWPERIATFLLSEGLFCQAFVPKVVIDYHREAYTYPFQKIRITFDQGIRASHLCQDFLNENLQTVPTQDKEQMVLEIKYEDMLPDFVAHYLSTVGLKISGYSKFVTGRQVTQM
jgi:hypothetical protein